MIGPAGTPKRILILNWRDMKHEQAGGAEVYAHELAKRFVASGHEVYMFCGNDGHSLRHEVIDGVDITRRGGFNFVYIWATLYYIAKFRKHTDIIIDCHNGIPFFTPLYSRKKIYCVLHHVHQHVFKQYMKPGPAHLAAWLERVVMPYAYRNRQYITVSQSSKDGMVEELGISPEQISVVHNGIDTETFIPGAKSPVPIIIYLGRLKAYKSVDILIKAFADVLKQTPDAQLVIGGTGDAEPSLKKLANELDISENVAFLGFVSEEDKVRLMQEAWVFCSPSFTEGWGITVIEASACGTPVVASDVPGLNESVKPGVSGYLVPYGNVGAFTDKLLYIIRDKDIRNALNSGARGWAGDFSWDFSAIKFLEVIK